MCSLSWKYLYYHTANSTLACNTHSFVYTLYQQPSFTGSSYVTTSATLSTMCLQHTPILPVICSLAVLCPGLWLQLKSHHSSRGCSGKFSCRVLKISYLRLDYVYKSVTLEVSWNNRLVMGCKNWLTELAVNEWCMLTRRFLLKLLHHVT